MEKTDMHVFNSSSRGCSLLILLVVICAVPPSTFADDNPTPSQMAFFPSVVKVADNWVFIHVTWDELEFPATNAEAHPMKRGEYWRMYVDLEPPNDGPNRWNFLKPGFVKNGWTVVKEPQLDGASGVLRYTQSGRIPGSGWTLPVPGWRCT
jgi:hypothetical protein